MLVLKWNAEHECKNQILADGINARIHLIKGGAFQFPESAEKVVRKKFSDALTCGYCVIEKASKKTKPGGSGPEDLEDLEETEETVEIIEKDK